MPHRPPPRPCGRPPPWCSPAAAPARCTNGASASTCADAGLSGPGDAGSCVVSLQTWLNIEGGYDLDVDGVFGSATRRAVTDFQARHDLPTAGMFGPRSRAALGAWWRDTMSEAEAVGDAESVEGVDFDDAGTDLHRGMGDDELWSVACAGAGMIVGWVTKSAALGGLAGLVCDIYIRPGSGG